jgi:MSHA pilin protein MshA
MCRSIVNKKRGFTLIELVIVILILAIMSAIGVSRFVNVSAEARGGSLQGMRGAINSAVLLARAKYRAAGNTGTVVNMDGASVDVISGIPCAGDDGIVAALFSMDGFSVTTTGTACSGTATTAFRPDEGGSSTCQVSYSEANGSTTVTSSGC